MSRSAETVEHEVEQSRERLDRTLDELQSRLNVSGLAGRLTDPDWRAASPIGSAHDLLSSTRKNPVPALMICVGLGLLLYESFNRKTFGRSSRLPARTEVPSLGANDPAQTSPAADTLHGAARSDEASAETGPGSAPVAVRITR